MAATFLVPMLGNTLNSDEFHRTTTSFVVGGLHQLREISTVEKLYWNNSLGLKTTELNLVQYSTKVH